MSAAAMSSPVNARHTSDANSIGHTTAVAIMSEEDRELLEKWEKLELTRDPVPLEDMRFMVTSKLAFSIALFKNSTAAGQERHALRTIDGQVHMKKEGAWVPLSVVRANLEYDPRQEKLTTRGQPQEVWSYLSPNGLVKFNRFQYDALPVVEQISDKEYQKIFQEAKSFWWEGQPEVDAGQKKDCVLQIVTTNRSESDDWLTENAAKGWPEHATFRLVSPDGKVYSFGFQMEKDEENSIFKPKEFMYPLTFLKTTDTKISTPDYEETRPYLKKRVTPIPITKARMDAIAAFVADQNKKGISFNFIRQNCATLASVLLGIAGVQEKPERWTLGHGLASLLPEWARYPYIGKPLAALMNLVNSIWQGISDAFHQYTPECIQPIVTFIPRKYTTFVANTVLVTMGARLASQKRLDDRAQRADEDNLDNQNGCFTRFTRLVSTFGDMFREDLSHVDSHQCLIEWQEKQASTQVRRTDDVVKLVF